MLSELEAAQSTMKFLHRQIKNALDGLDEEGLNWVPEGVEAVNSVYGLALHIANSQVAFVSRLGKVDLKLEMPPLPADGNIFHLHGSSAEVAKAVLRQAAELTNGVFENLTPEGLEAEATLPGGGKGTGHSWVQLLVMHTAEHLGHLSLTRQLYQHSPQK